MENSGDDKICFQEIRFRLIFTGISELVAALLSSKTEPPLNTAPSLIDNEGVWR